MNQQDTCEDKEETAPLADLALNTVHEEETKGADSLPSPAFPAVSSLAPAMQVSAHQTVN